MIKFTKTINCLIHIYIFLPEYFLIPSLPDNNFVIFFFYREKWESVFNMIDLNLFFFMINN